MKIKSYRLNFTFGNFNFVQSLFISYCKVTTKALAQVVKWGKGWFAEFNTPPHPDQKKFSTVPPSRRPWSFIYDGWVFSEGAPCLEVYRDSSSPLASSGAYITRSIAKDAVKSSRSLVPLQGVSNSPYYSLFLREPHQTKKWRILALSGLYLSSPHFPVFKSVCVALWAMNRFPCTLQPFSQA